MPIYAAISVENTSKKILKEGFHLNKYGFFARMTIKNLMRGLAIDFSRKMRSSTGFSESNDGYTTIEEKLNDEKIFIVTKKDNRKRVVLITDGDYNSNVRFKALLDAMETGCDYEKLVEEYKEWKDKDNLTLIEKELKASHENIVKTLSAVLDRDETLNDLVEKSEHLSAQTKKLYQQAKKQNRCCN